MWIPHSTGALIGQNLNMEEGCEVPETCGMYERIAYKLPDDFL